MAVHDSQVPVTSPSADHAAAVTARLTAEKQRQDLWAKQEDIAMHFNDLTMRLRLQALAGIGAAVVAAGSIFSHEGEMNLKPIGCFLMALALVWLGIFLLDLLYYQALLKGAVKSILEIEATMPVGRLSAAVENAVGKKGQAARYAFYGIVFVLLIASGYWMVKTGHAVIRPPAINTPPAGAELAPSPADAGVDGPAP